MHEILNAYLDIISHHILYHVRHFKTNEPLSRNKLSFFLFVLKSGENADTAFCIMADDMPRQLFQG